MRVLGSARRHGLADDDILHAIANVIASDPAHEDGIFFLGPDHAGQLLEVLARQTPDGLVVFHAMPLTPKYRRRYLP
ncbi:MAG: hypothetical protein M0Z40_01080 [Actinomycetota bacterium]|nr:hypothetical protein [Actinomycetota bacterium]MDA8073831.1 hypothetical protein [Actinomycetota bacterium]